MSLKEKFIKLALVGQLPTNVSDTEMERINTQVKTCATCIHSEVAGLNANKTIALFKCTACNCKSTIDERILLNKECVKNKW